MKRLRRTWECRYCSLRVKLGDTSLQNFPPLSWHVVGDYQSVVFTDHQATPKGPLGPLTALAWEYAERRSERRIRRYNAKG